MIRTSAGTLAVVGVLAGCGGGQPRAAAPAVPGPEVMTPAPPSAAAGTPPPALPAATPRPERRRGRERGGHARRMVPAGPEPPGPADPFLGIEVTARGVSRRRLMLPQGLPVPLALRSGDRRRHTVELAGPSALRLEVPAARTIHPDLSGLAVGRYGVRVDGRAAAGTVVVRAARG